jgi:hypothetical protein
MQAREIQLNTVNDIHTLLNKLEKQSYIKLVEDQNGNTYVDAEPGELAKHLILKYDGNTYLVEDATSLNDGPYIQNLSLAEAIASIKYVKGSQDCLSMALPQSCPTNIFPIVFPIITPQAQTYDFYDIAGWVRGYQNKASSLQYHNSREDNLLPLSFSQLIENRALQQLIQINFQLAQQRMFQYVVKLAKTRRKNNNHRLHATIKKLRKTCNDYEFSYLHRKMNNDAASIESLAEYKKKYDEGLTAFPRFKGKILHALIAERSVIEAESYNNYTKRVQTIATLCLVAGAALVVLWGTTNYVPGVVSIPIAAIIYGMSFCMEMANGIRLERLEKTVRALNEIITYLEKTTELNHLAAYDKVIDKHLESIAAHKQNMREHIVDLYSVSQSEVWEAVLCLIEAGVDVNENNLDGHLLLSSLMAGRWDVAKSLIENGLSINELNKDSFSFALKRLIETKKWDEAAYFIEQGALFFAEKDERKLMKMSLKKEGKWTNLSASSRLFKAKVLTDDNKKYAVLISGNTESNKSPVIPRSF